MPKILIVDDDRDFREILTHALGEMGHTTAAVPNGLKLMGALKVWVPDIVLMDVRMSWIDGLSLTRSLKKNPMFSDLPVVVMTASHDPDLVEKALDAGAQSFLTKPFNLTLLSIRIGECLLRRDRHYLTGM